jgi:hypothetical protein
MGQARAPPLRLSHPMRRFVRPQCFLILASLVLASVACGSRTELPVSPEDNGDCPGSARPIYLLTPGLSNDAHDLLMRFDPRAGTFALVASVPCLGPVRLPTAMAVDRAANAYVAGSSVDRRLFRVSTATGACQLAGTQPWFAAGAMAFSKGATGGGETLYLANGELASLDTTTFAVGVIGPISGGLMTWGGSNGDYGSSLTGTAAGDLFTMTSFSVQPPPCKPVLDASVPAGGRSGRMACISAPGQAPPPPTATIGSVDTATGSVVPRWTVTAPPNVPAMQVEGFAFWGGDFYFFIAPPASGTEVWRFRPSDGSIARVAQIDSVVLAVGVSTCAPLQ